MSQMSNEAAEEMIKLMRPVTAGLFTGAFSGLFVEFATPLTDDFNAQGNINTHIASVESELNALHATDELLNGDQAISNEIEAKQLQISELEAKRDSLGNQTVNGIEAYGIPVVLGCTVAFVGLKRAIRSSRLLGKNKNRN